MPVHRRSPEAQDGTTPPGTLDRMRDDERATAWVRTVRAAVRAWWAEVAHLVLPVRCAGCDAADVAWCPPCRSAFDDEPWRCEHRAGRLDPVGAPALPVLTLADCAGPVRAAVIAWKDRGRRDLTRPLVGHARRLGLACGELLDEACAAVRPGGGRAAPGMPVEPVGHGSPVVLVVPAPSTSAARRRRGFAHVDALARGAAEGLGAAGRPARVARVLRRPPGADQVGRGVRDRARLDVRVAARHRAGVRGRVVVLVDDVLTSGATLAAAQRALVAAGALPCAAVTLASTPGPATRDPHRLPARAGPRGPTG